MARVFRSIPIWFLIAPLVAATTPEARLERGLAAARAGNCAAALPDLEAVLKENERLVPAINAIGVCHALAGDPERAAAEFERVTKLEPNAWQAWNNLGASYLNANQPQSSIQALRKAVKLAPTEPNPWFHLGSALGQANQPLDAFDAFDHAQRLAPKDSAIVKSWLDSAAALATQASDLIERKDYSRARLLLERVGRPLESSASWQNLLGYAEFKLGRPEPALAHLQKALTIEPDNEDYLLDMGEFLGYYRVPKNAVEVFEVASKRMPQSPRVQFGLAVSYIMLGRRPEAATILETLIAANERFEPAYAALGECYEDAGNAPGLVALGRKLQTINPRNATGFYLEGAGELRLNLENQATGASPIPTLQEAARLNPRSARLHFTLAKAFEAAGQNDAAIAEFNETLRLEPAHERAHYLLGRLYQKTGEPELARAQLEEHRKVKAADRNAEYRALLITSRNP